MVEVLSNTDHTSVPRSSSLSNFKQEMFSTGINRAEFSRQSCLTCESLVRQLSKLSQAESNWMEGARIQWLDVLETELGIQLKSLQHLPQRLANHFLSNSFMKNVLGWVVDSHDLEAHYLFWLQSVVDEMTFTNRKPLAFKDTSHKISNQSYYGEYLRGLQGKGTEEMVGCNEAFLEFHQQKSATLTLTSLSFLKTSFYFVDFLANSQKNDPNFAQILIVSDVGCYFSTSKPY